MPLIEPDFTPEIDDTCKRFGLDLYNALRKARRIIAKPQIAHWAQEFAKLRKSRSDLEINTVLTWFRDAVSKPFTPQIYSAATFRQKFPALEKAAQRDGLRVAPALTTDPEIIRLMEVSGHLIWPNDEKPDEPEFVRRSIIAYRAFLGVLELTESDPRFGETTKYNCRSFLSVCATPHELAAGYLMDVHHTAVTWDGWRGKLLNWVWSPTSRLWRLNAEKTIAAYGGWVMVDTVINAN